MGKTRKPLAMQRGNLTVLQQTERQQAEESIIVGREELEKTPTTLINAKAKNEYKRIVKELEKISVIGNLDLNNLVGYCNAYAFYIQATKEAKKQPMVVEKATKNGMALVRNPIFDMQMKYADEMRKFGALCGLTVDSRLKVGAIKVLKQGQQVSDKFGDI